MMLKNLCKTMMITGFMLLAVMARAEDMGYIKHQLINNTSYECYMSVRQQYAYPIEACLGPVPAKGTKACDGPFEPHQPNFFFYAVCNAANQHLELDKLVFLRNTYKNPNIDVQWTIEVKKKKLQLIYHEHGF